MAKKRSSKPVAGSKIRVKDGVDMPEFPEQSIEGWTGTVMETQGRGSSLKVIIEWTDESLSQMSDAYKKHCDDAGLFSGMACLPAENVELVPEQ